MDGEISGVTPGMLRLWGVREERPPRGELSVEKVVEAAIAVADEEGFEAVSMKKVADKLGFTTMALYRHVTGKEELVELMRDVAGGTPPEIDVAALGWRAGLEAWSRALRDRVVSRLWLIDVPVDSFPVGPNQVAWLEAGMKALSGTRLTAAEKFGVMTLLLGHVRFSVGLYRDLGAYERGDDWPEAERDYGRILSQLVDSDRFPELSRALAEDPFPEDASGQDLDADLEFGLAMILDGVERLAAARS